jgi:hypothetical protein
MLWVIWEGFLGFNGKTEPETQQHSNCDKTGMCTAWEDSVSEAQMNCA